MPRDEIKNVVPVILAGGAGRRLWPLSRKSKPKPFLKFGRYSYLQKTCLRVRTMQAPYIVCNADHYKLVQRHLGAIDVQPAQILLESCGRNTAPAIGVATSYIHHMNPDALILVLPSDHLVKDIDGFISAINEAVPVAQDGKIVLFGIKPNRPETGYGYIQKDKNSFSVKRFCEKPDRKSAVQFLKQDDMFWNSGMFLFSASTMKQAYETFQTDMWHGCENAVKFAARRQDSIVLNESYFSGLPNLSIDYAVMEHADNLALVKTNIGWRDIGSWTSFCASFLKPS